MQEEIKCFVNLVKCIHTQPFGTEGTVIEWWTTDSHVAPVIATANDGNPARVLSLEEARDMIQRYAPETTEQ